MCQFPVNYPLFRESATVASINSLSHNASLALPTKAVFTLDWRLYHCQKFFWSLLHPLARGVNASQSARRRPRFDAPMVKAG